MPLTQAQTTSWLEQHSILILSVRKKTRRHTKEKKKNLAKLQDREQLENYQQAVCQRILEGKDLTDSNKRWDNIKQACLGAASETLGM